MGELGVSAEADSEDGGGGDGADVVRLVLPAEAEYGRIARIAVSSMGLRMGLPFPAIDDLRLALDETIILLLRPDGEPGEISIEFTLEPGRVTIDASSTAGADQEWHDDADLERFDELVRDTVDAHEVDLAGHRVHLVKTF